MNEIKKLSDLAVHLKQAVETYSQHDYEQLHQELLSSINLRNLLTTTLFLFQISSLQLFVQ